MNLRRLFGRAPRMGSAGGGGGGGGVTSFAGRAGVVVPVAGDYTSTLVDNLSVWLGGTGSVTAALNAIATAISALVTGVSSFNARTGAVVPVTGDYQVSQLGIVGLTEGAVPFFNGTAWQTVGIKTSGLTDADGTDNYSTAPCFFWQGAAAANRTRTVGVVGAAEGKCITYVFCDVGPSTWALVNGGTSGGTLYTKPAGVAQMVGLRYNGTDFVLAGVQDLVFS